ncbi:MAG: hypothetical protein Q4E32_07340 [Bacteroidales bacterium]|nr:hypothetical protein [Bacteroidales bacterium]
MKKIIFCVIAALSVAIAASAISHFADDEPCRSCNGRGWYKCNMCDGEGWRECSFCGGEGYVVMRDGSKETCASCQGKKGFKCGYCKRGQRQCTACYGTGKQRYIGR